MGKGSAPRPISVSDEQFARNWDGIFKRSKPVLNILTWLWDQQGGRCRYSAKDVNLWARQVSQNLAIPHKLYCVTNIPEGITEDVGILPLPDQFSNVNNRRWSKSGGFPQCFRRLDMFAPDAAERYGERFVSMDLDCVVTGNLDPLFDRDDDFIMLQGTRDRRPFNGSMLMMDAGARPQVYTHFTPQKAEKASTVYVGSDQAWIGYALGFLESVWTEKDGVYCWEEPKTNNKPNNCRIIFFPGRRMPRDQAKKHKWLAQELEKYE